MRHRICAWAFAVFVTACLSAAPDARAADAPDLIGAWRVKVEGEPRERLLRVYGATTDASGSTRVEASYGWADERQVPVRDLVASPDGQQFSLTTPAKYRLTVARAPDGSFKGRLVGPGYDKPATVVRIPDTAVPEAAATGEPGSPGAIRPGGGGERARLEQILRRPAPENVLNSTLSAFYKEQSDAAIRLGDGFAQLHVARKFATAAKGTNEEPEALWRHWRAEADFGDRRLALKIGEERVKDPQHRDARAGFAALLAHDYLQDFNDLKRAEELLKVARDLQAYVRSVEYRLSGALQIETTQTLVENHKGRFREALAAGESAVKVADEVMDTASSYSSFVSETTRHQLNRAHFNAHRLTWQALAASGQPGLAEAKAIEYYHQVVLKQRFAGQPLAEYLTLLGGMKYTARKFAEAIPVFERALQVGLAAGMGRGNVAMYNAGGYLVSSLVGAGRHDEAVRQCEQFIRLKQRYFTSACGLAFHMAGKYDEALRNTRSSMKFWSAVYSEDRYRMVVGNALVGAHLVAKGERADGKAVLQRAFALLPDAKAREPISATGSYPLIESLVLGTYLDVLADEHAASADPAAKLAAANEAFRVASQARSSVVQQSAQDAALRVAAGEAGLSGLVRTLQDGRAEAGTLYEFLSRQLQAPPDRQLPQVVESMRKRIAELEAQEKRIEAEIAQKFPAFRELTRPSVPSPQDVAARLRPNEAFLLVLPQSTATHLWAVAADGVDYARMPLRAADLDGLVARLRRTLELGERDVLHPFDAAAAYDLHRQLVAPVSRLLAGKTSLLVSASGSLARIPFGALLTDDSRATNASEHPYLVRKFAVSHVVSPAAWLAQMTYDNRGARASGSFAGFADPVFSASAAQAAGGTRKVRNLAVSRAGTPGAEGAPSPASMVAYASLSPLPETRDEVLAIAGALKAVPERDVFLGLRASRDTVLKTNLEDRAVVVFATHGLMAGDLPTLDEPGLALSITGDKDAEPVLKLSDVLKLRLNADWVVLSACNTAAADRASDETFSGLGRGFFYAGARALLLTHWAVETHSAKALTTRLFERFTADTSVSRAEALRQAQLSLIESRAKGGPDHAHPFFWAPFALVGDGRR